MQRVHRGPISLVVVELFALCISIGACTADIAPQELGVAGFPDSLSPTGKQIALGRAHGCSLDAAISGVLCWGDNRRGQTTVPYLLSPKFVATGGDTTCAIATGGVRCWGDNSTGQTRVPFAAQNATQVALGDAHACAVTSRAVACWGDNSAGQTRVPSLSGVETIAAGARHTCALGGGRVTCWGDNSQGQTTVPELGPVTRLAAGGDHTCVVSAGEVKCWGGNVPSILTDIPDTEQPEAVAVGPTHACALDSRGVQCWGDIAVADLTPRELTFPNQLAVGGGNGRAHACARHLQGVTCWGSDNLGQASYDGRPLHVLHRSESVINAPASRIWDVIVDLDAYPEWNPYTIHMESTFKVGDPMNMKVKMSPLLTIDQTEYIRVIEGGHKVCWGINTTTPEFNSGERCQWLEELPNGSTRWVNEDLIEGTANPLVTALFGDAVQDGFDAVAVALKARAE